MSYDPMQSAEEITEAHTSAVVFPELPDDITPLKFEWNDDPGMVTTACGCLIEVYMGDTVWALPSEAGEPMTIIAVDPVTIH